MNHQHTIAVIGGTGKAGKYLTAQLLQQGFNVRLLHRAPETVSIAHPLLQIVKGDARNYNAISSLLKGATAVISTLGQPKGEPAIFSRATTNVIQAMAEHNTRRYVVTTGLNVDVPADNKSPQVIAGTGWMKQHYPETTFDKQKEYELLTASDIDWVMVRLPLIEQTAVAGPINISTQDCPGNNISAASLAVFLISQLNDNSFVKQAPFIANADNWGQ